MAELLQGFAGSDSSDLIKYGETHAAVADVGAGLKSGIELGQGIGEVCDRGVLCAEFVVVGEHIREAGGVSEQVSESDGSQCSAAEVRKESANGLVEEEAALSGELYDDECGDGFGERGCEVVGSGGGCVSGTEVAFAAVRDAAPGAPGQESGAVTEGCVGVAQLGLFENAVNDRSWVEGWGIGHGRSVCPKKSDLRYLSRFRGEAGVLNEEC